MEIKINDKTAQTDATTLKELVEELQLPANGVAIALDSKMVQRACWADTPLKEGANVIIIKAACGG
ncbi:MAG: sulfur carrier protein ThiS [Prevotellaceae bacterium]|nr:sulfur carrier protein ThiS [Prevotellaceae bacterium]